MATRPHTDLRTLGPNVYVEGVYSLINPQMGTTRGGKAFLKCLLRDATGEVVARQWSFDEGTFAEISSAGFVWAVGHTQLYNGQIQFIAEQVRPVQVDDEELAELLPKAPRDIEEMYAELTAIMQSISHPAMKALVEAYLGDEALMAGFKRSPAAVVLHHAYIGGLLEHTLQLLKLADVMLPHYPRLNRDITLMGLFLHDLGKIVELAWEKGFEYTTDGNLIGHVVRGTILLQAKAAVAAKQSGKRLPVNALKVLQHIVLSHHGELEHGAVKVPATPEAIFVSMLDNLDARTAMALAHARPEDPEPPVVTGDFTEKIWALGTRLFRPDPLSDNAERPLPRAPGPEGASRDQP